jgi:hypothetical protein
LGVIRGRGFRVTPQVKSMGLYSNLSDVLFILRALVYWFFHAAWSKLSCSSSRVSKLTAAAAVDFSAVIIGAGCVFEFRCFASLLMFVFTCVSRIFGPVCCCETEAARHSVRNLG